jgi:hypothetical protein
METNLEREAKSVKMFDGLVHKLVKFPCPKKSSWRTRTVGASFA